MKHEMRLDLDRRADAVYVTIDDGDVASTRKLDPCRMVDYDSHGEIVGIEFLNVSSGVDLHDLPYQQELSALFDEHQIKQYA